jgi:RHS repeat-associated protein
VLGDLNGSVQNSYAFDAWGVTRRQSGTLANPFGYTGREFGDANDWFYRARYYSPGVGRFQDEDSKLGPSHPVAVVDPAPKDAALDALGELSSWWATERDRLSLQFPRTEIMLSQSLYAYTLNHPVLYNDPTGMDNPGCDGVPVCFQKPPIRHCCDLHDHCYFVHGCRSLSWIWTRPFSPCDRCNGAVLWCILSTPVQWSDPSVPLNTPNPYPASYN